MSETKHFWSLKRILKKAISLDQVRKEDRKFGDFVLVVTQNSAYLLYILQDNY